MERITLGQLTSWEPPPEQEEFFKRVISILDEFYPENWRSWEINNVSYQDLFGEKISSDDENRLRFAIPTIQLAYAYGSTCTFSERKYKAVKRDLINSPLGRALIYSPFATMKRIHPTDAYNGFMDNLSSLKRHLLPRREASLALKNQAEGSVISMTSSPVSIASASSARMPLPRNIRKRAHSPEPATKNIESYMEQQSKILSQLLEISKQHTMLLTQKGVNCPDSDCSDVQEEEEEDEGNDWIAPALGDPEPSVSQEATPVDLEEKFFDFAPDTKESENKIGSAEETLVKQGIHCQRLGESSWQNIRYADVQKQFQATPVFSSLKVNSTLATVTPNWQTVALLEKMDACLGAITHGLLQQRKHFQDIYNAASLEVKSHISKNFLATDSAFRRTSDSLLQYTCGKRAEIIQHRRYVYKPVNKTLNELLHNIPPSNTHLFAEPQLADYVKEQGGINRFFPGKKHTSQNYKQKWQYKNSTNQGKKDRPKVIESRPSFRSAGQSRKRPTTGFGSGKSKRPRFEGKAKF